MKALIAYFSHTGNTKQVSSFLACYLEEKGIEYREIKITPREKNCGLVTKMFKSFTGKAVPIEPCKFDPGEFDLLFVGTPVWAYQPAPAINAFLEKMPELKGMAVYPFVTMAKSGDTSTIASITKKVEAKGGHVEDALSLQTKRGVNEDHLLKIEAFVNENIRDADVAEPEKAGNYHTEVKSLALS